MKKIYELTRKDITKLLKDMTYPITHARTFFLRLALFIDQATQLMFRTEGQSGGKGWVRFSPATLRTPAGTWNIRYGTDLKGRTKGTYRPGKIRPGIRRYSGGSKLLQASGGFRQSFKTLRITNNKVEYGTRHRLARDIMSNPVRQVLIVTNKQKMNWLKLFIRFYRKGLKFA